MQPQLQHLRKGSSPFASPASPSHPRTSAPAPSAYSHRSVSDLIMIQSHSLTPQEHTWHTRAHILMSTTNIERTFIWKAVLLPPLRRSLDRAPQNTYRGEGMCVCVWMHEWVWQREKHTFQPSEPPLIQTCPVFFFFFKALEMQKWMKGEKNPLPPRGAAGERPVRLYLSDSVSYTQDVAAGSAYLLWH